MRRPWYGRDTQLTIRMIITMFLLFAVYLAFIAVITYVLADSPSSFVFIIVLVGLFFAAQYYFSDKMVLWSMKAKEVSPQQAPELHAIVDRLAQQADLPKPKVALVRTSMPNAFATGHGHKAAVVAVTTGLLDTLEPQEIEAVLAHELSHVKNHDMAVLTIASFLSTLAFMIMRSGIFLGGGRRGGKDGGAAAIALIYMASIVVWVISFFLIRALSRYREYAADRGAVIITGAPAQLESALLKISGMMGRIPQKDLRQAEALNAFFIIPAAGGGHSFMELFSTHPNVEKRIARLRAMQQEMEAPQWGS